MKSITLRVWVNDDTDIDTIKAKIDRSGVEGVAVLSDKEIADIADGNAQRAYYATVRGFVEDLKSEIKDGNINDADGAREWLEQSIDGCHDVIYTHAAQEVLRHSSNDSAYFDDFGSEGAITDNGIEWSKLAYCAILADVYEELGDLDELFTEETEEAEA
jgi:hypothetical protein